MTLFKQIALLISTMFLILLLIIVLASARFAIERSLDIGAQQIRSADKLVNP